MTRWRERIWFDVALRLAGVALLLFAWAEGDALCTMVEKQGARSATLVDILLAVVLFASASMGTALVLLGRGLWAPVTLSDRWTIRDR